MNSRRGFLAKLIYSILLAILGPTIVGKLWRNVPTVGNFGRLNFPIIKGCFPELLASEICGVQPLNGPTNNVFYLNYNSGDSKYLHPYNPTLDRGFRPCLDEDPYNWLDEKD